MSERAAEIGGLLLREGALRKDDPEHGEIYAAMMGDSALYREVEERLAAVGFQLVQELGHMGVRVAREAAGLAGRNRMGLHRGHVRLIVYLWVHLVYREWSNLRRGLDSRPPGAQQSTLFPTAEEDDEPVWISYQALFSELGELLPRTQVKGQLRALKRWRFVRYDERRDRVWADASLYTLVDRNRMEDFVVRLARQMGVEEPAAAVTAALRGQAPEAGENGGEA